MSKKHLIQVIKGLSVKYSKSQDLYGQVADVLSDSMISPEVYDTFCEKKNKLDIELSNMSNILSLALNREEFLSTMNKANNQYFRSVELMKSLKDEELSPDFQDSEDRRALVDAYQVLLNKTASVKLFYKVIDGIASIKNRKKNVSVSYCLEGIEDSYKDLEIFVKENIL